MTPPTHRCVVLTGHGAPERLQLEERPLRAPGRGELRLRVLAAGVAATDLAIRRGKYPGARKPPFVPGYDAVGVVDAVGEDVEDLALGTTVAAVSEFGGYAEYAAVPASRAVPLPQGVEPVEAAASVLSYTTAQQMLHRVARVRAGERILVHGGAGAVGLALLQLGGIAGLERYATAGADHHDRVRAEGGVRIDYRSEDFVERIRQLTGEGVDAAFDSFGGEHLNQSFRTLRRGGRLVSYGASSVLQQARSPLAVYMRQILRLALWSALPNGRSGKLYAIQRAANGRPHELREDLATVLALLDEGRIRPRIAATMRLEDAAEAHGQVEAGAADGKIVLTP